MLNSLDNSMSHKQVPAKVTAYVDEGIKELVEALNSIDKVETIESCEGNNNNLGFVLLNYGDPDNKDYRETVEFAVNLNKRIAEIDKTEQGIYLAIEWWRCGGKPIIQVKFSNRDIKETTNTFVAVASGFRHDRMCILQLSKSNTS